MSSLHVLLTGATGVVGSSVLQQLLSVKNIDKIYLLVRAQSDEHLQKRQEELLTFLQIPTHEQSRLVWVRGDITQPSLGVSQERAQHLRKLLTNIIHCAASVDLTLNSAEAEVHCLKPLQEILSWQEQILSAGRYCKLDFVSTVGVLGRHQAVLSEEFLRIPREYHNGYESAKAKAEEFVSLAVQKGAPITVHRPSMVIGNAKDGRIIHFQIFYLLITFLSGVLTKGWLPSLDDINLDTVPSDFAGRVIAFSLQHRPWNGKILHLCSGFSHAITIPDLEICVQQELIKQGVRPPSLRHVKRQLFLFVAKCLSLLMDAESRRRIHQLPLFFKYTKASPKFSNEITLKELAAVGISVPQPTSYISKSIEYFIEQKKHRFTVS